MPTYSITAPNGKVYSVTGPAGATQQQVQQQILASHPEAAQVVRPAASRAPAPAAPATPKNFLERLSDTANTYARPVMSFARGAQNMVPGIDHIQAGLSEIPGAAGANSSMSYGDRVRYFQAQRENEMNKDVNSPGWSGFASAGAHYAGELAGAGLSGVGEAKGAGMLLSKIAPEAGTVGSFLARRIAQTSVGGKAAMIASAGAASGAAAGAANSTRLSDVPANMGTGAAAGAVAAPLMAMGVAGARKIIEPVADAAGLSSAAGILRRYIGATNDQLQTAYDDFRSRAGPNAQPTLFELLPTQDRKNVQKMLGIVPATTNDQAIGLIQQRIRNMGPEISDVAQRGIAPQRDTIVDGLANDLAASRSPGATVQPVPTAAEAALAAGASRNPSLMRELRQTEATNIMAPHENTPAYESVRDLIPQHHELGADGIVSLVDSSPPVSNVIRSAAGGLRASNDPITGGDISHVVQNLNGIANGSDPVQRGYAAQALAHIRDIVGQDHPDLSNALNLMNDQYAARSRMLEGYDEGANTRLRQNIPSNQVTSAINNAYTTPEGQQGRVLGQGSQIDQNLSTDPGSTLRAAGQIADNPTTQAAISTNISGPMQPGVGQQIAAAADAQTAGARRLAGLDPDTKNAGGMDLPSIARTVLELSPGTMIGTKARALANVLRAGTGLPAGASSQIVDSIFSGDPSQVSRGLGFLNNSGAAGQKTLQAITQGLVGTDLVTGAGTRLPSVDPSQPAPDGGLQGEVTDTSPATGTSPLAPAPVDPNAAPVDPNAAPTTSGSPYAARLQTDLSAADPTLQSLWAVLKQKESGNRQFDKNGQTIISPKGAVGVAQVMPSTALATANRIGVPFDPTALHADPNYNELLGAHTLDSLLSHYGGDKQKAAAAYNAGPGAVDRAIASATASGNPSGWLSSLPAETRNYAGDIQ